MARSGALLHDNEPDAQPRAPENVRLSESTKPARRTGRGLAPYLPVKSPVVPSPLRHQGSKFGGNVVQLFPGLPPLIEPLAADRLSLPEVEHDQLAHLSIPAFFFHRIGKEPPPRQEQP